jgi:hypothetical protein
VQQAGTPDESIYHRGFARRRMGRNLDKLEEVMKSAAQEVISREICRRVAS